MVVEVKSTISKEPRKVWLNNERQLDDRGLKSLHLFVATVQITDGGRTLPDIICALQKRLEGYAGVRRRFDQCLISAGYLDSHESLYMKGYILKSEELFRVLAGFPRIIDVPNGVGSLRYCVVLSACYQFSADINDYLKLLRGYTNA
jgi:hypothetical protein